MTGKQQSVSQRFRNLDEYLLWLEQHEAPIDGGWYKEIRPGVYELQTGGNLHLDVPVTEKRIFTREELERQFVFKKYRPSLGQQKRRPGFPERLSF